VFQKLLLAPPIRRRNIIGLAIAFVASFIVVSSFELAALAAIGVGR
jgi:hypothetical protein